MEDQPMEGEPMDDAEPVELAMFPLGSVLLPGMVLPLRVFEPRYRVLVDTVLLSDRPEFASVVIERGSEVGGGDVRASTGCLARIVQLARHDDGTVSLVAVGARRVQVVEWLDDDPFPRATVRFWDDEPEPDDPHPDDTDPAAVERTTLEALDAQVQRVVTLAGSLDPDPDLGDHQLDPDAFSADPSLHVYQLATVSPLGAHDRLKLLGRPTLSSRTALLAELLAEQELLLEARRTFGQD